MIGSTLAPIGRRAFRFVVVAVAAVVAGALAACVAPQAPPPAAPSNPFLGAWATGDHNRIVFRPDTIVQTEGLALDKSACNGVFRFDYGTRSREALTALVPNQPELRARLSALLGSPRYEVAELACDRGDQTYVLLDRSRLVAIYRDGAIAAIEGFSRI